MILSTFYQHIEEGAKRRGLSLEDAARACISWGITGLDVISGGTVSEQTSETVSRLLDCGMHVNSMPVLCDPMREPSLEAMDRIVETALCFQTKRIMTVLANYQLGDDREVLREQSLAPLRYLIDRCAENGITVGMEDFDNAVSPTARIADLLWFLERLPGLTCTLDTGNFLYNGEELLYAYSLLRPYITTHIHCKDRAAVGSHGERANVNVNGLPMYPCAVGEGMLPIEAVLYRLVKSGFDGAVTIEHYGSRDHLRNLEISARNIQRCFS